MAASAAVDARVVAAAEGGPEASFDAFDDALVERRWIQERNASVYAGTMEAGDCLLGVSMQPGGSSRVVIESAADSSLRHIPPPVEPAFEPVDA